GHRPVSRCQRTASAADAGGPDRLSLRLGRLRAGDPGARHLRSRRGAPAQEGAARPFALRPDDKCVDTPSFCRLNPSQGRNRSGPMEKILAEYRRQVGDFEIVDVDEKRVEQLRAEIDVDVPLDLHWTWNYASEVEELRALYERGKRGQWNAEEDID